MSTNLKSFNDSLKHISSYLVRKGYDESVITDFILLAYSICDNAIPTNKSDPFGFVSLTDVLHRSEEYFKRDSFCPVYKCQFVFNAVNYYLYYLRYYDDSNVLKTAGIAVFRNRTNFKLFDMNHIFGRDKNNLNSNRENAIETARTYKYFERLRRFSTKLYLVEHARRVLRFQE